MTARPILGCNFLNFADVPVALSLAHSGQRLRHIERKALDIERFAELLHVPVHALAYARCSALRPFKRSLRPAHSVPRVLDIDHVLRRRIACARPLRHAIHLWAAYRLRF